ncbi:MAG: 6-phosphogluconolactonase, partial [Streptosporangiaceae bacterium]
MHHELQILADPGAVARAGAAFVAERARAAVAASGSFHFAVSGGHTPWAMFAELASQTVPWDATVIYQVDERVAPSDDPDRNLTHLTKALGSAPAQVRPMPVNESDLVAAAASYAALL